MPASIAHSIAVANARVEGLVTDLHMSELHMFRGHCTCTELTTFRSWKSVPHRLDLIFYRLCSLRGVLRSYDQLRVMD